MKLTEKVREIAAEKPDYVYFQQTEIVKGTACRYTKNTDGTVGGCIIGRALLELKPDLQSFLEEMDTRTALPASKFPMIPTIDVLLLRYPELTEISQGLIIDDIKWLSLVQKNQDFGLSWGESIEKADKQLLKIKEVSE